MPEPQQASDWYAAEADFLTEERCGIAAAIYLMADALRAARETAADRKVGLPGTARNPAVTPSS